MQKKKVKHLVHKIKPLNSYRNMILLLHYIPYHTDVLSGSTVPYWFKPKCIPLENKIRAFLYSLQRLFIFLMPEPFHLMLF